jgi:hypothetical protein
MWHCKRLKRSWSIGKVRRFGRGQGLPVRVPESIGDRFLAPFCLYGELYGKKDLPRSRLKLLSTIDNMVSVAYIIEAGTKNA